LLIDLHVNSWCNGVEEKKAEDSKYDKEFDKDNDPELFTPGHSSEPFPIESYYLDDFILHTLWCRNSKSAAKVLKRNDICNFSLKKKMADDKNLSFLFAQLDFFL